MIEIRLLEQLVTFADCGTQSRAAERLHITQPALSRSMRTLETKLGVALFDRSAGRISLNETGRVAVEQARRVLATDEELIETVRAFDRGKHTIRVGACTPLPLEELMPELKRGFKDVPVVPAVADDDVLLSGLSDHGYQLAIVHNQPTDDSFFWQRLFDERLFFSMPPSHRLADRPSVRFADLAGVTILVNGTVGFWLDICQQEIPEAHLLVQEGLEELERLVNASALPVFNSDRSIAFRGEAPGHVSVPVEDESAHATYYLACLASEHERFAPLFRELREHRVR